MSSDLQKTNKIVLIANWVLDSVLIAGYIVEYLKGAKTLEYILGFFLLVLIPMLISTWLYFKNKQSNYLQHITMTGYLVVYTFAMFTAATERILVFVYMFPIMLMYLLYFNLTLIVIGCSLAMAVNAAKIGYYLFVLKIDSAFG